MSDLVERMRKGDRRALARLLSLVEEKSEESFELLAEIWPYTGRALTVGVTGPAGAGKSTMIDQLITWIRKQGKTVGVVAVDPSSPFTGGAVLGDRVRMQRHSEDKDVYIRSVGSRGRSGGLSFSTRALVQLLDAFGIDVILLETVGAGQSEVAVADIADTTVVVLVPEAGDAIQTLKAGILEIAHVYVVNKKDRPGADLIAREIETSLMLSPRELTWKPPIVMMEAVKGVGVEELWEGIERHQENIREKGLPPTERFRRNFHELAEVMEARVNTHMMKACRGDDGLMKELEKNQRPNLYALAKTWLNKEFPPK